MNSVSPSAAQYIGGVMQDELVEDRRQQPLEQQGSFSLRLPQAADSNREATGEPDDMDKLKAKLMSAWNNVKYGLFLLLLDIWVAPSILNIFYVTESGNWLLKSCKEHVKYLTDATANFCFFLFTYIPFLITDCFKGPMCNKKGPVGIQLN